MKVSSSVLSIEMRWRNGLCTAKDLNHSCCLTIQQSCKYCGGIHYTEKRKTGKYPLEHSITETFMWLRCMITQLNKPKSSLAVELKLQKSTTAQGHVNWTIWLTNKTFFYTLSCPTTQIPPSTKDTTSYVDSAHVSPKTISEEEYRMWLWFWLEDRIG